MSVTLRIVLIIVTILYLITLIRKMKIGKLQMSFSIFWMVTGFILILISIFPSIVENLAEVFGFQTPSNMLFLITIFIAYYLIFELTMKLSQEYKRNTTLVQEISLLKRRVEIIEKANKKEV